MLQRRGKKKGEKQKKIGTLSESRLHKTLYDHCLELPGAGKFATNGTISVARLPSLFFLISFFLLKIHSALRIEAAKVSGLPSVAAVQMARAAQTQINLVDDDDDDDSDALQISESVPTDKDDDVVLVEEHGAARKRKQDETSGSASAIDLTEDDASAVAASDTRSAPKRQKGSAADAPAAADSDAPKSFAQLTDAEQKAARSAEQLKIAARYGTTAGMRTSNTVKRIHKELADLSLDPITGMHFSWGSLLCMEFRRAQAILQWSRMPRGGAGR